MFNVVMTLDYAPGLDEPGRQALADAIRTASRNLPGIRNLLFAPTLPNVYNGGDYLWRGVFDDAAAAQDAFTGAQGTALTAILSDSDRITKINRAGYEGGRSGGSSDGAGLYRVALFCANNRPNQERLEAFGRETASMPDYVRTILRWQLSTASNGSGDRPWTHVWEQEYANLDGLMGPYMMHPVHWALVERWFDTEYPEHLVDPVLVHTFCAIDAPVIINR